ncbi:MAG TPA: RNA polymerase sigma factor [Polyangiales bacterium]|nr:RNA polymerase sigma factor [Polyangiales bacterium]
MPPEHRLTSQALFQAHSAFVWRVLRRLGVHEADVADVCQDVFIAVHTQLPRFEARSKPSTWIYGIARRRAASYRALARHRREQLSSFDGDPPERFAHHDAGDGPERARLRSELDALLAQLDDDKREVFVLYEIEGLDMPEVVEIVGCPLQTGYGRLHAARARLRQAVEGPGVAK